ncbi:MAG TPA: YHYH protein [Candidatus Binatia bacterium]|nr:YHYH protein [Candidatus Binatia bacterium]
MPHTPRAPLHPAHATRIAVALLVAALAASGGVAAAIDQTILGSQLVVKDPGAVERRSVVGTARETASPNAIVGDPVAGGGQLEVAVDGASSTSQTFALPPGTSSAGRAFWSTMGTTGYQYRDPKGDNGPVSVVKIHRTASGTFLMSVRLKGKYGQLDVVPPNPGTGGCLALSLAGGDRYSAAFGADSVIANRGTLLFSAKKPLSEALCPVVPTPTPAPTPTPTGGACAATNFLDVSNAAGPSYNGLMPSLAASCSAATVNVQSNGIPTYMYVALTPNGLQAKSYNFTFPRFPTVAANATAVPLLGNVGVAVNGIPIYGVNEGPQPASDAYGDPIAASILDECGSHSAQQGTFHFHKLQVKCLVQSAVSESQPWNDPDPSPSVPSPIVGYAFDGFPIYGPYECTDTGCSSVQKMLSAWDNTGYQSGTVGCTSSASCSSGYCTDVMINGAETTACVPRTCVWSNNEYTAKAGSAYLDQCNGHVGPNGDYHYHTTTTFPYILGCYRGAPTNNGGTGTPPGGTCP